MTDHNSTDMTDSNSTDAASLAQSFKALFPIPLVGSSNPYHRIVFEHMQSW